jgi:hypothetical protein
MVALLVLFVFFSPPTWSECQINNIQHQSIDFITNKPWQLQIKRYAHSKGLAPKHILIIPSIAGETFLERSLANYLCSSNVSVSILDVVKPFEFESDVENLNVHNESYLRAHYFVSDYINLLEKNQDNLSVGLFGMSQGAMLATYIAAHEKRILATVIAAGGGNVPDILTKSDQSYIRRIREERMKQRNLSHLEDYHKLMEDRIPSDPLFAAPKIASRSVYFFIASQDTTVPTSNQFLLRSAFVDPSVFVVAGNHRNALIKVATLHRRKIRHFFNQRL